MLGGWSLRAHGMGRAVDYEDMEWPRPKPKQEKSVRTKPARGPSSRKRIVQLSVAAAVVVVAVAGAAAFFLGGSSASDDVGSPPTLVSNALDTAFEFGTLFRESASRDLSAVVAMLRRSAEDEEDTETDEEPSETGTEPKVDAPRRRPRLTQAEVMAKLDAMAPSLSQETLVLGAGVGVEAPLFMVFDNSYSDVEPPGTDEIRLRTDLLPGLMSELESAQGDEGVSVQTVGMVEVTVSEFGQVEKARLISAPANIHESMLLSAIKAWRFTPAKRHGQAVRYRQVMPITVAR